ncbi:hypothetical protein [Pasteurella bettyae]|uniref:hypothetical protein n=1 Tax=Pasteurella bettyae TaxID=752 RepID=UPI003D2C2F4B
MTEQIKIELSEQFKKGRLNTSFFKDIQTMIDEDSNEELALIFNFMQDIANQKLLRGKNKPSWLNDNLETIPNTEFYETHNIWHYHCGPYAESAKFNAMSKLKLNLNGETSSAVIHYQKITDNHIFILAYSPKHEPFPKERDIPNPLLERLK